MKQRIENWHPRSHVLTARTIAEVEAERARIYSAELKALTEGRRILEDQGGRDVAA